MADEVEEFEPKSKRPRISLELAETELQTVKDNSSSEKTNNKLSDCVQRENIKEKLGKSASSTGTDQHVRNDEEVEKIMGEDEKASVDKPANIKPAFVKFASVSEKDVGIREFVSSLPGFHGVLKQRYTDFIVSERDLQGNLVRLTDVSIPQDDKTKEFDLDILSEEDKDKIKQVVDDEEKKKTVTLTPDDDKDHRRLVHRAIRANFSSLGKVLVQHNEGVLGPIRYQKLLKIPLKTKKLQ